MSTQEIKLKIHEEADLFSEFDPDQNLLSGDVVDYLERNYLNKHRSVAETYTLHIISDTPVNEERVKTKFAAYFTQEKDNVSYTRKRLILKQALLFAFGLLILLIWFYLSVSSKDVSVIRLEVLSIMGWVAIWEATSIAILELPRLTILKKAYERIIRARIDFIVVSDPLTGTEND